MTEGPAPACVSGGIRDRATMRMSRLRGAPMAAFWVTIVAILVLPIVLFLLVAVSPRLMDQGSQWFTLSAFRLTLTGPVLRGVLDSVFVAVASAVTSGVIGLAVAWVVLRTDAPLRALWPGSMFALLLAPSYLMALGWERLLEPMGVLDVLGAHPGSFRGLFYGPFGVIVVLTAKGIPFAYLAISNSLRGLGEEFENAVRVHGGRRVDAARIVVGLLAPAMWSALSIVFAESVSDFGVASTLANAAHFPVATFALYNAVDNFPVDFPVAACIGWILTALAGVAIFAQSRAMRGRSYRVLGGRTRPARLARLSVRAKSAVVVGMVLLLVVGLGVPALGAVSASLINGLGSLATSHGLTLANYRRVFTSSQLNGPLLYSARLALVTATVTTVLGAVCARMLGNRGLKLSARLLDLLLITAVALPGIVFAAGYIFTYNLPLLNNLGIHLYETTTLLVLGYVATALPSTSRVLLGPFSQIQRALHEAGRVHGSGGTTSWARTVLPVLSRSLLAAWVLTFSATLLELPVSQLLYPPNQPTVSVGIERALANYDYGGGNAMEVIAVLFALAVVGVAWGLYRLLAPTSWRHAGRSS